jgi:phosphoglycerate dehydrogenase-like enzyme
LKRLPILINIARGKIVDENKLAIAIKCKRLLAAVLDTWAYEPINADNPLLELDNVLPHLILLGEREMF